MNETRVYVASSYHDFARTRRAQAFLRSLGYIISCDWTAGAEEHIAAGPSGTSGTSGNVTATSAEEQRQAAAEDLRGVATADMLLCLTPGGKEGCGVWVELGAALALRKFVVMTGENAHRSVFGRLAHLVFASDAEALRHIEQTAGFAGMVRR